jgi:hypothetical protein
MAHKKINFQQETKLSRVLKEKESKAAEKESLKLINSPTVAKPKTFRLRAGDINRLKTLVTKANELAENRRFNDTDIIRALLLLEETLDSKKLLSLIRKSV